MAKSDVLAPVKLTTMPSSGQLLLLERVSEACALVVPTSSLPNASGLGVSDEMGTQPPPGAAGSYSHKSLRSVEMPLEFK